MDAVATDKTDTLIAVRVPQDNACVLSENLPALVTALKAQNQVMLVERNFLMHLFDTAPGLMCVLFGPQHVFEFVNRAWLNLMDRDVLGISAQDVLQDDPRHAFIKMLDDAFTSRLPCTAHGLHVVPQRRNGTKGQDCYLDLTYQPIFDNAGAVYGVFVSGIDVTKNILAQKQQQFLMEEMNHRIKNVLATVSAIAVNTLRGRESPADFVEAFQSRLRALSRTHDALVGGQWDGADLHGLLQAEFEPYGLASQITLSGETIRLTSRSALALGMVFHELAINAAKYGALSIKEGQLDIHWQQLDTPEKPLVLKWLERNGPPTALPKAHGFGSRLIERSIAHELNGALTIEYEATGLSCHMILPHQAIDV